MSIVELLRSDPHRFQLFQALRLLELEGLHTRTKVRVWHLPHLWHTASDLHNVDLDSDGRIRIDSHVFGLLSPSGPLPLRLIEDAIRQARGKRGALGDFLSLLGESHLYSFYSAWRLARLEMSTASGENGQKAAVRALTSGLKEPEIALCMLAQWRTAARGCEGLRATVQSLTGFPCVVEQLIGEWLPIPLNQRSKLGGCSLGVDTTVGSRQWARHGRIRLVLHVQQWEQFQQYIPSRKRGFKKLHDILSHYLLSGLIWTLDICLPTHVLSSAALGRLGRLGEDAWLGRPRSELARARFGPRWCSTASVE